MTEDTTTQAVTSAPDGRYSVAENGQIFWQENASNPLPGVAIGILEKGEAIFTPKAVAEGHKAAQDWLDIHIRTVLEPLFKLMQTEGEGALTGASADIGGRLYDHLGVIERQALEDVIPALDADMRKGLRSKGVRMGPLLVFLPALVKPAAVRMRALLWALWNDKPLPIAKPADGRVSEVVDMPAVDHVYYRMIGYPVFGPRAIRIDMLDRVVTDVYDTAAQGVFEAKHKYAEWLGCGLDDLHAVLEAMGHRKLKVDAPVAEVVEPAAEVAEAVIVSDNPVELVDAVKPKPAPVVVKFMLKRGKMSASAPAPRAHKPYKPKYEAKKPVEAVAEDKKDFEKKFTPKKAYDPNKAERVRDKPQDGAPRKPKFDREKPRDRDDGEAKVYSFEGKKSATDDDNNPFAILKNLKT